MSTTETPDSGASKSALQSAEAATSPGVQSAAPATESSQATQIPSSAKTPAATAPSGTALSGDTIPATQPAAGGENVAPVQETATTTPVADTKTPHNIAESSPMSSEEPKAGAELSSEQSSADVEGKEVEDTGPALHITLLLITGSRHPFTIDGKYLRKRSVNVENNDPFAMSVYTLKELIWREWRSGELALKSTLFRGKLS